MGASIFSSFINGCPEGEVKQLLPRKACHSGSKTSEGRTLESLPTSRRSRKRSLCKLCWKRNKETYSVSDLCADECSIIYHFLRTDKCFSQRERQRSRLSLHASATTWIVDYRLRSPLWT